MAFFKAAMTEIENHQMAIIWLDTKYLNNEVEIKKHLKFFKELIDCPNIVIMILDQNEKPSYYGKKEIVEVLQKYVWKKFPWQSFQLDKVVT
jgi:hypothetical protein